MLYFACQRRVPRVWEGPSFKKKTPNRTRIAAKNSAFGTGSVDVASGETWGLQGGIIQSNLGSIAGVGSAGRAGAIDNISGDNALSGAITLTNTATIGTTAGNLTLSDGANDRLENLSFDQERRLRIDWL